MRTDFSTPILRKGDPPVTEKTVKLEFKIFTEPTFDETSGDEIAPPHWELLQGDVKMGWGPMESARSMWRFFSILAIATQLIPTDILEDNLRAMQAQMPTGEIPA